MQRCSKCGTTSPVAAPFCSTCGASLLLGGMPAFPPPPKPRGTSGMAITGFVLSFVCGLLGLIFSLIGFVECKKKDVGGSGFALAGIILSIVNLLAAGFIYWSFVRVVGEVKHAIHRSEARITLMELSDKAERYYHEHDGAFPETSEALNPSKSCCEYPDNECPAGTWEGGWKELGFQEWSKHGFRYSFRSSQNLFEATAVGDLDCDGDEVTYRMILDARDGNPQMRIIDPESED
ncbi:MAG TPA: DUF4190 domain-containing protein [Kofleriaceae bacterium]|nr:DUF4190 domain-containing protein [Kofleriaceae bacterium]